MLFYLWYLFLTLSAAEPHYYYARPGGLHNNIVKPIRSSWTRRSSSSGLTPTMPDANIAFNTLQQWYNASIGVYYPSIEWWNSANSEYI